MNVFKFSLAPIWVHQGARCHVVDERCAQSVTWLTSEVVLKFNKARESKCDYKWAILYTEGKFELIKIVPVALKPVEVLNCNPP